MRIPGNGHWLLLALAAGAVGALRPGAASAHDNRFNGGAASEILGAWGVNPLEIVLLLAAVALYAWLWRRLRRTAPRFRFSRWRALAYASGVALAALALLSPIDTYSDDLFLVHMLQHVILVMGAAPLLVLGMPGTVALRAASPRVRRAYLVPVLHSQVVRFVTAPLAALALFTAGTWIWHWPALYDAAIGHEAVHILEHGTFVVVALLFWGVVLAADPAPRRAHALVRAVLVLGAVMQSLALSVTLLVLREPAYQRYIDAAAVRTWGPDALRDQRLGAGLVHAPAHLIFGLALIGLIAVWLRDEERRTERADRLRQYREQHPDRTPSRPAEQSLP